MEITATVYGWERGETGLIIQKTGPHKLENKFARTPKMIYTDGQAQVLCIEPPEEYRRKEIQREQRRIKSGCRPHWPAGKICIDPPKIKDGIQYFVVSPFCKLWVIQDGDQQLVQIVHKDEVYEPPKPPTLSEHFL